MKAKLIVDDQEIEVQISEEEYKRLLPEKKKTGYEQVKRDEQYYYQDLKGLTQRTIFKGTNLDKLCYDAANHYSDDTVASNNARADKLMRQLRRFAVEHREKELNWKDVDMPKHVIYFDYEINKMDVDFLWDIRNFGDIGFDLEKTARLAINIFHDELIWYFTEYKDSL